MRPKSRISGYAVGSIFIEGPFSRSYANNGNRSGRGESDEPDRSFNTAGTGIRFVDDIDHPSRVESNL
jgi:hypothetical protein